MTIGRKAYGHQSRRLDLVREHFQREPELARCRVDVHPQRPGVAADALRVRRGNQDLVVPLGKSAAFAAFHRRLRSFSANISRAMRSRVAAEFGLMPRILAYSTNDAWSVTAMMSWR